MEGHRLPKVWYNRLEDLEGVTGVDPGEMIEMAESMLDCQCGHGMGSHNGNGCYARLSSDPLVKCACRLDDDRTYPEILANNLSAMFERLAELEREAGDMEVELEAQMQARVRLTDTISRVEVFYKEMDDLPHYAESGGFRILDEVDLDELKDDLRHAIDGTPHPRVTRVVRRARRATRKK